MCTNKYKYCISFHAEKRYKMPAEKSLILDCLIDGKKKVMKNAPPPLPLHAGGENERINRYS